MPIPRYFFLRAFLPPLAFFLCLFAGFDLVQPVTAIVVRSWIWAPFWPTNSVGMTSGSATFFLTFLVTFTTLPWRFTTLPWRLSLTFSLTVLVVVGLHRLPLAASAE